MPTSELKKAATELAKRSDRPWSAIPLAVVKRTIPRDADGQRVLKFIPLPIIAEEVITRASDVGRRDAARAVRQDRLTSGRTPTRIAA